MSEHKTAQELLEELNSSSEKQTLPSQQVIDCPVVSQVKDAGLSPAPVSQNTSTFNGFDIKDPVELLYLVDHKIQSGEVTLWPWQIQFMIDFANEKHDKNTPFRAAVQACNSSGKDKYIIAACAVWLCMRHMDTVCPVTSASGNQLDTQTSVHLDRLCAQVNAFVGKPIWKIQYRYYECQHVNANLSPAPSTIKLFATDEEGKAEGYHPVEAGAKMALFTGETKSIPGEILDAISRCHGFTHRVDVSSPGIQTGYFYNTCTSGIPRDTLKDIKTTTSEEVVVYKITYKDCPHITESEANRMASELVGGRNNSKFQSSMMAEFGSTDEKVVIPSKFVWQAIKNQPTWIPESYNTGGLDLSDGGAETVLAIRNGNKLLKLIPFNIDDTPSAMRFLEQQFRENGLDHPEALIFGDYTGLGWPLLKLLKGKGWKNIRYVDSRNSATNPKSYTNRGTELFFNMSLLLERGELIFPYDKLLVEQLCGRYYKLTVKNVHALLSKEEQRSRGYPSPDRADAVNLAFWNYKSTVVPSGESKPYEEDEPKKEKIVGDFDLNMWAKTTDKKLQAEHVTTEDYSEFERNELQEQINEYNKNKRKLTYA